MPLALTPEQKIEKKQRDNLKFLHNRILSAFSFKQITKWEDVNSFTPVARSGPLTYVELKDFLQAQSTELENKLKGKTNVISPAPTVAKPAIAQVTEPTKAVEVPEVATVAQCQQATAKDDEGLKKDYGLKKCKLEKASLFWFQKKACKELLDGILV